MITVDQALTQALALMRPLPTEGVALRDAMGRYMPGPALATRDQPPFDASAMDGYAIVGPGLAGAQFAVVGEAGAGHAWGGVLRSGQALRIFTGAPLPAGANCVVIQEDTTRNGDVMTVTQAVDVAAHIRPAGQDFRAGDSLSPRLLRPNDLALLAAMNVAWVRVTRRPVVAIIATGDELVMPGEAPAPDQIIASNSFALAGLVQAAGATARLLPIARDTVASLSTVLALAADADLILTTGGASVGDHDLMASAAQAIGIERSFWKIAMRPGKPLMAGRLGGVALLGLPGNPVSTIVCAHLFALPMIRAALGMPSDAVIAQPLTGRLGADVGANGPRTHYMRARLGVVDDVAVVTPFDRQDSSLLSILASADALLIRPLGDAPRKAGDTATYLPI